MRRSGRRGGALLETAMFAPILLLLLVGMSELARVTYTYYSLQKMMYTAARYVGTQQAVNFCDDADLTVVAAKNLATTGTLDGAAEPLVRGMTAGLMSVRAERYDTVNASLGTCECSATGCDAASGAIGPDFIVVDIPDGYTVQPVFPKFVVQPFLLRPRVRVPYGGT